ncbi:hypothetical protein LPJ75_006905 [Coemansia sp. RSA 2598]|nr:hypothetical protein LPJ75_006905 [Coemansia sp. RSA 2598]
MVGGTRDIDPNDPSDSSPATHTLSPVHAVQKSMAEHYYNDIYHRRTDTYDASPQALGGAAAIRVLSQEDEILRQMPSDIPADQILVGCVMAEVERLLVKRGAERSAGDLEAALENVGRVALSTVFDIKSSQSRGLWERNSEPARDTLRDSWRDEYQETLMHGDGRGHWKSRRVRAVSQDYGYRGAADHGDGYYDWQLHGSADGGYGGGGDARATRGFNNDYSLGYEDGYY